MEQLVFLLTAVTGISVAWTLFTKIENASLLRKIEVLKKEHRSLDSTATKLANENNRLEYALTKPQYIDSELLKATQKELEQRTKELAEAVESMDKLTKALGIGSYAPETMYPFRTKVRIPESALPFTQNKIDSGDIYTLAGLSKDSEIAFFINTDHELCATGPATKQETDSVLTYFNRIGVRTI